MELNEIPAAVDKNENSKKPLKKKSQSNHDSTISLASTLIEDTKNEIKFDDQITMVDEYELEGPLAKIVSVLYSKVLIVIGFVLIMAEIVFYDKSSNNIVSDRLHLLGVLNLAFAHASFGSVALKCITLLV